VSFWRAGLRFIVGVLLIRVPAVGLYFFFDRVCNASGSRKKLSRFAFRAAWRREGSSMAIHRLIFDLTIEIGTLPLYLKALLT
jgi:hypothetical protein